MRKSTRQAAKQAAKAKLSGAIQTNSPKNNKIVFGDDDDSIDATEDEILQMQNSDDDVEDDNIGVSEEKDGSDEEKSGDDESVHEGEDKDEDDDAVEEVKGSAARESTQKLRKEERKVAKESMVTKKKRKKTNKAAVEEVQDAQQRTESSSDSEQDENDADEDEEDNLLTDDFFKMVDSERANQVQKTKQEKKHKKIQLKKRLGKHTTFVVESEYKLAGAAHPTDQNIEVIALGGVGVGDDDSNQNNEGTAAGDEEERQLLLSATLGLAPSKAATLFARGGMSNGTSKERSSDSRKRKSKNEETWKRSRKMNRLGIGAQPGRAAALFVCKR